MQTIFTKSPVYRFPSVVPAILMKMDFFFLTPNTCRRSRQERFPSGKEKYKVEGGRREEGMMV
jgi:hypothetical protein